MRAQTVLPRWRGFNLVEMCTMHGDGVYQEDDFRIMADLGFDFVRLPCTYLRWVDDEDPFRIREASLDKLDRGVDLGIEHGLHVSVNLHRAPGYCINPGHDEPFNLWKDAQAVEAFCLHWTTLARRYRGISSDRLSFDLVNEPPHPSEAVMTRDDHARVIRAAVAAIRAVDPERLIIIDGLSGGNAPSPELADLGVAQSCRAYLPMGVSHYKAPWWTGSRGLSPPTWPGGLQDGVPWDRARLEEHYEKWASLARRGVGVHCGEGGCFIHTPHDVFLRWFREVLEILTGHGIGFALWNLRGAFGILDSGRPDVAYEDWYGHKLDRKLLDLLQEFA